MGQPLPLPERVPVPKVELRTELEAAGVTFATGGEYVEYTMPDGWSLNDKSHHADIPEWFMVDNEGMCRAFISGAWKGTYDNYLRMVGCKKEKYIPREEQPIPSETDGPVIATKFANAMESQMKRNA